MTSRLGIDLDRLEADLRATVRGEVRFDPGTLAAYSTDASNYRQVPLAVVVPRDPDDAAAAVAVCVRHRAPVLSRGGGTSLAGECTNTAVVLDWSKHCTAIEEVDLEGRTAVVQPGLVLDVLNGALEPHGLRFGPEPSTHPNCTIGGMVGNNSCGATAQAYGKTVDNIRRLEVVTGDGERFWVGPVDDPRHPDLMWDAVMVAGGRRAEVYRSLRRLGDEHADLIRSRFPDIPRRVSGYNLDSLLPGGSFHPARALVGSESTCVTVVRAELELSEVPRASALAVLGFPDIATAGDAVPEVLPFEPFRLEGVDHRLADLERARGPHQESLDLLPAGGAWLFVELAGESEDEARDRVNALVGKLTSRGDGVTATVVDDPRHAAALWAVREAGLGATARPGGPAETTPDTWPGWEDAAVAPDRLGDYLRDFQALFDRFGYRDVSVYGHFGQGCVHCRIPFDLVTEPGIATFRSFLDEAAHLVVRYGGSLSGEHGDGQARGPLLEIMFGADVVDLMRRFRAVWDPHGLMNPGKVVDSRPATSDLRLGADWAPADPADTEFTYPGDDGSFQRAVLRCVGVGKCHSPQQDGRVMCPSYRATRDEQHSTRGRSRLLFEMLDGHADTPIKDGWRSDAVKDALDLCLACKGCLSDCPMHVDMATYKAEFLSHHYARRLRPRAHYAMGWLPLWARLAHVAPELVNALSHAPGLERLVKAAGGVAQEREVPRFGPARFTRWFADGDAAGTLPRGRGQRGEVLLWPDTFTDSFHPWIGVAAVQVLEAAGFHVVLPQGEVCCGLTWISTGQLGTARRVLRRTARRLAPAVARGTPVVALEPSCTAVFRSDATNLLGHDRDAQRLSSATRTLSELLLERAGDWVVDLANSSTGQDGPPALVQVHCHQHAVLGQHADVEVLRHAGVHPQVLDSGCCGLAGNFGFEDGHYEVSMACAEDGLLPALRESSDDTVVVADGFSCRTQIEQSHVLDGSATGREPLHLAQVLANRLQGGSR